MWALAIAYLSLLDIERGSLTVPFALVALGAIALSGRSELRPIAFGLIAGAAIETAIETAFFI